MARVIAPIVTPFKGGKVDNDTLKAHAENLLKKGVDLLFVNGTTGLGPALSPSEKAENLRALRDFSDKVIFQVGELDLSSTLQLIKLAEDYGVKAIASYPIYYFQRVPEKHIVKYFRDLCDATDLPVYLYNYPLATGKDVDERLVSEISCLSGVKDTNESFSHTMAYKRANPNMVVYNGSDSLVFLSLLFLDGTVSSVANYLPEALVAMKRAAEAKDLNALKTVQGTIDEVVALARKYGSFSANYELVRVFQGYSVGKPRPPVYPLEETEVKQLESEVASIKEKLASLGVLRD
ncbi:MAG: bifunctional 2-dehydro-3-deoxy-phosphogluconate/2-dehydro-3-deoxy-6-phosphogalactonate aldolase [Thermoprotei archaeon]